MKNGWFQVSLHKGRVLIVVLVLLGFISQAMASAVIPLQMPMPHQAMTMMDHSSHGMGTNIDAPDVVSIATSDCCKQDCYCPMMGCVSVILPTISHYDVVISLFQTSIQPPSLAISQLPISLYRPPITA